MDVSSTTPLSHVLPYSWCSSPHVVSIPRTVELNASFIPLTLLGIPSCFRHLFHFRSGLKSFTPPPPWINILPTKTLKLSTPQFALYGAAPSYDHLRVFGCKCYPNLSATAPHKLSPRSTQCVFFWVTPLTIKDTAALISPPTD